MVVTGFLQGFYRRLLQWIDTVETNFLTTLIKVKWVEKVGGTDSLRTTMFVKPVLGSD